MLRPVLFALTPILAACFITGCGSAQVPMQKSLRGDAPCYITMRQMQQSLIAAAKNSGWSVKQTGRGSLQAQRKEGSKMAKVAISHTNKRYHISYLDSEGLGYDGENIGNTYNLWLNTLKQRIAMNLPLSCKSLPPEMLQQQSATAPHQPSQRIEHEVSVLIPEKHEAPAEEIDTPLMIESVPQEMMIIR
jgi:hypothetical protein